MCEKVLVKMSAEEYVVEELVNTKHKLQICEEDVMYLNDKLADLQKKYDELYTFINKSMEVKNNGDDNYRVSFSSYGDAYSFDGDAMKYLRKAFPERFEADSLDD